MPAAKFRVAIWFVARFIFCSCGRTLNRTLVHSGGGIGGLCLAVSLLKFPDVQVDIYEAAGRFQEIGAGVMIWSRTWRILSLLGMASEFSKIAHAPPDESPGVGFDYRRSDQPQEGSRFYLFTLPYGCIRFHRAQFLDVLVDHLPDGVAHFGKRLRSYSCRSHEDSVKLHFVDGTIATCDLLVGCDGIKSVVRQQLLEEKATEGQSHFLDFIDPVWTGTIAYRGLIPVGHLARVDGTLHKTIETPMMYCGKNKHVVSYSISRGSIVNVVAFASDPEKEGSVFNDPWVADCTQPELLDCYAGWEPEVVELLKVHRRRY
ncbi:hypothetical protein AcV5_006981 [Taiwanofungus camphoratus]|nr:hypothetical protein AcV5_006981 [Antrodia cinnamomea]KAI0958883.1 hypothetical protein AcV7_004575 [Antrodia cinnamomea]